MKTDLPPEALAALKPQIISRAKAMLDKLNRMIASGYSSRELECFWVGILEWKLFVESVMAMNSPERASAGEDQTIGLELHNLMCEIRRAIQAKQAQERKS